MATRFYLPSSGTSPLASLAVGSEWEGAVSTFYRAPTLTTKQDTAMTDFSARFLSNDIRDDCWAQWVSPPLSSAHTFTTSETVAWIVRVVEADSTCNAYLRIAVRVVSNDGGTVRGTPRSLISVSNEHPLSPNTRYRSDLALSSEVAAQAGDRIVLELGCRGVTPATTYDVTNRFGDDADLDDFALGSSTDDLCPWIELSADLAFSSAAARPFVPDLQGGLDCNLTGGI